MKIIERVFNAETGETTDIERDMTTKELKDHNALLSAKELKAAEETEKAAAKDALLTKLGITEDEAKLLLS